jgi:hypothetical protein
LKSFTLKEHAKGMALLWYQHQIFGGNEKCVAKMNFEVGLSEEPVIAVRDTQNTPFTFAGRDNDES